MTTVSAPTIRRLAPDTAARIAAGEVIERPLSALKEILENALDSGARRIEVVVERSLDHRFSVADDGHGIGANELELSLERHATSKLTALEDLDHLRTLGFRGEALPSIAAVSRLTLTSRPPDADAAAQLMADAGSITALGTAARAHGTTVEVRDLFFNTPARRKFLSSPAGELRAALRLVEHYGLAYPEVAFRVVVDGRQRLDWAAAAGQGLAAIRERATSAWGARHAGQRLEVEAEKNGVRLTALLGLPEHGRANREGQTFLINRRWIQSPLLSQALRQAYGNLLPAGRFPAAALWLDVPSDRLDVNVHPTKREVRFADDDTVFSLVAGACAQQLAHLHPPFTVVYGTQPEPRWAERANAPIEDPSQLGLELGSARPSGSSLVSSAGAATDPDASARWGEAGGAGIVRDASRASEGGEFAMAGASSAGPAPAGLGEPELWQLHRTYILAPVRGGLVIIDQHAAHERVLFEEAMTRLTGRPGVSQRMLFPTTADLTQDRFDLLLELGPWLEMLGWDLSPLSPPTVAIQGTPPNVGPEHAVELLQDLLDGVGESTGRDALADVAERVARSFACHAAVRAGDPLTLDEMRMLVDRLFATSRPHGDPHGRPTFVRLDLDELHRRFGRS
ncbi:MAG: DNA mismatch repair endonuclease MutL [Candidatus Eisenbacteria bacterium]|uniref:DNA mismatch repair protein MutL n=1 Tax=Eiseniibacteriota bacterium TaxID=2212470 RepID=A0A849SRU9_UNCEI|nr:DNA mismatch repair endonuclease MutL [Candidatus Eisenbacteria bacterium]